MLVIYTVIDSFLKTGLDQFIVEKLLLEIGLLYADADRVSEIVDDACALSYEAVVVCVELEEVAADVAKRNHTLDHGRLYLNIHSPFCKT